MISGQAAAKGIVPAPNGLGQIFESGRGGAKDPHHAPGCCWPSPAAARGKT